MQVRGAGCASCGPSNMRYGYDRLGRLTEKSTLDAAGRPIQTRRTELDRHGRPVLVSTIAWREGRPQAPQWQRRYEYAPFDEGTTLPSPQPVLIARPSVIAGQEHRLHLTYNSRGQPTEVTETGFSPVDGRDRPATRGHPIRRTTTYTYVEINNRSLLAGIDGPLPNGRKGDPADSDITRYEWDAKGNHLRSVSRPGGLTTSFEVERDSGRLLKITDPNGYTETYTYAPQGQLDSLARTRGDRVIGRFTYRHDAQGRTTELLQRIGEQEAPQGKRAFDAAGRLQWQASALGVLRQAAYDSESRLVSSTVLGAGVRQQERYAYDDLGRLALVEDDTGAKRRLLRDPTGRIAGRSMRWAA